MIKRKIFAEQKKEKIQEPRQKKVKVDLNDLPDAIVEGKFVVPIGEKVFFERTLNGVKKVHVGQVKSISEDGLIQVWDETREQWFAFTAADSLVIKSGV